MLINRFSKPFYYLQLKLVPFSHILLLLSKWIYTLLLTPASEAIRRLNWYHHRNRWFMRKNITVRRLGVTYLGYFFPPMPFISPFLANFFMFGEVTIWDVLATSFTSDFDFLWPPSSYSTLLNMEYAKCNRMEWLIAFFTLTKASLVHCCYIYNPIIKDDITLEMTVRTIFDLLILGQKSFGFCH